MLQPACAQTAALWTFGITFCPPDTSWAASIVSQCATEFSNCNTKQLPLLRRRWGFLIHLGFRRLVCAIKFFCTVWFSVHCSCGCFHRSHELVIRRVARSLRKLHCAAGGFSMYHCLQQMPKLFPVQQSLFGNRLLLDMCCHCE